MTNNREENIRKSQKVLPPEVQHLIVTCLPNIPYGANWGFTDIDKAESHLDALKNLRSQGVVCRPISANKNMTKVVEEVNWNYLMSIIQKVDSSLVTKEDKAVYDLFKLKGQTELVRFLTGKNMEKQPEAMIGIYCINKTSKIVLDGREIPAFCINAESAKQILDRLGYRISIRKRGYLLPSSLVGEADLAFSQSMLLSPTGTGVFIKIRRFPSDIKTDIKIFRKQFSDRFNEAEARFKQMYKKLPY